MLRAASWLGAGAAGGAAADGRALPGDGLFLCLREAGAPYFIYPFSCK